MSPGKPLRVCGISLCGATSRGHSKVVAVCLWNAPTHKKIVIPSEGRQAGVEETYAFGCVRSFDPCGTQDDKLVTKILVTITGGCRDKLNAVWECRVALTRRPRVFLFCVGSAEPNGQKESEKPTPSSRRSPQRGGSGTGVPPNRIGLSYPAFRQTLFYHT